jgi:hypothetical protein
MSKVFLKMIRTSKDQNVENQNLEKKVESLKMTFDVLIFLDAKHDNQNVEIFCSFSSQKYFRCSDITYGFREDQNVENQKDQLPMAYYLCVPRPVGG